MYVYFACAVYSTVLCVLQGRLLQQSFYGCVDGSCWANRPWLWNPVQGGSWQNAPGLTTKKLVKTGGYVYAEGHGR
jgi:hypothetical protein